MSVEGGAKIQVTDDMNMFKKVDSIDLGFDESLLQNSKQF
jgi:hypothetical protein